MREKFTQNWLADLSREKCYGVAVSGGADSVALLRALKLAGFSRLNVLHVNHLLRGEESARDEEFVRELARDLGCEFRGWREDARARAVERGISLETAGREIRHQYFAREAEEAGLEEIFLGHHADDVAETLLWNAVRGSHGWRGMAERQCLACEAGRFWVRRPFLKARRKELREFLGEIGQIWREDASNGEGFCVRNRLRHEIFPVLEEIAQRDVVANLSRNAELDAEWREVEGWAVARVLEGEEEISRLRVDALRGLPISLQRAVVWEFLRRNGVSDLSRKHVERVLEVAQGMRKSENLPRGFCVSLKREFLAISSILLT